MENKLQILNSDNLEIHYDNDDESIKDIILNVNSKTRALIEDYYGIKPDKKVKIFISNSWLKFIYSSSSLFKSIYLTLTLPYWLPKTYKMWQFIAGWTQKNKQFIGIIIKKPDEMQKGNKSIGEKIFRKQVCNSRRIEEIVCHELTHAYTSDYKYPLWFNEGIAMLLVDKFTGEQTVLPETIEHFKNIDSSWIFLTQNYYNEKSITSRYIYGYWIVKHISDTKPHVFKLIHERIYTKDEMAGIIAKEYGEDKNIFWDNIQSRVSDFYEKSPAIEPSCLSWTIP